MKKLIFLSCLFFIQCNVSQQTTNQKSLQTGDPIAELKALYPQLMTIPNAVDTDKDSALSAEEVMAAPKQLATLDKNGDGDIDWKEMGAWETQLPLIRDHNITNLIDVNGDIHISAEEIKNASKSLRQLDQNKDWNISKEELFFNKNKKFPPFSNKKMSYERWRRFRGYTTKNEGPILPGQNDKAFKGYTFIHDAGDGFLGQVPHK